MAFGLMDRARAAIFRVRTRRCAAASPAGPLGIAAVQDQVGAIEGSSEEALVALELQFVRHDVAGVRELPVRRDDDIAFDAQRRHGFVRSAEAGYSEIVCTTLETGRELTVGSLASFSRSSSYCGMVCTGALARIATTL